MRELFAITADKLFTEQVNPTVIATCEEGGWPSALWRTSEDAGLGLALAAEERGGVGAGWADAIAIALAAGVHCAPIPLIETMLANWLLSRAGLGAVTGAVTVASRHDLHLSAGRLIGTAWDVPWGQASQHLVVLIDGATPRIVLVATSGARCRPGLNIAREPRDELRFDSAPVLAEAPLPAGMHPDSLRLGGALLRAAQITGGIGQLVDHCIGHANDRVQFGRAIGKFQAIQHQIAVLASQSALAFAAVENAFAQADRGLKPFDVAIAKIVAGEAAGQAAAIAHAVHGAIGFTYEHALHFVTRRLWSWRDEFGGEAVWAAALGRDACAAGGDALWPAVTSGGFEL